MKNMKKLFTPLMLTLFLVLAAVPVMALAEGETAAATPTEPLTWAYLATIAGAATFTLLVVQLFKVPLDSVQGCQRSILNRETGGKSRRKQHGSEAHDVHKYSGRNLPNL